MARSSLSRRVQAIEAQRNKEFAQQIEGALNRIETHPVDLALQLCILRALGADFTPDEPPSNIAKRKAEFDRYLNEMIEEDRNHVLQIVDEYQATSASSLEAMSAVTDNHTKDSTHD